MTKIKNITRAETAGAKLAEQIGEIIHLMYQNNTALNFITGLKKGIDKIYEERKKAKQN